MITEKDLDEAIAECQGVRNPTANTCIKLASFLTLKKELFGETLEEQPAYSFMAERKEANYSSDTDFGKLIHEKNIEGILGVMDDAMSALSVLNPPLYQSILRKIEAL